MSLWDTIERAFNPGKEISRNFRKRSRAFGKLIAPLLDQTKDELFNVAMEMTEDEMRRVLDVFLVAAQKRGVKIN